MSVAPSVARDPSLRRHSTGSSAPNAAERPGRRDTKAPRSSLFSRLFRSNRVSAAQTPVVTAAPVLSVTPRGPLRLSISNTTWAEQVAQATPLPSATFSQAFGALGIPLLAVVVVCIAWTTWLILLMLAPNEAANLVMNTASYDSGCFWFFVDPEPSILWFGTGGLMLVDVCYVGVLCKMLAYRRFAAAQMRLTDADISARVVSVRVWVSTWAAGYLRRSMPEAIKSLEDTWELLKRWASDFTDYNGKHRKIWNLCLKLADLIVQAIVLTSSLHAGMPASLILPYAYFLGLNGVSCILTILNKTHSAFVEVLIDSIFDLVAAVLYPIAVLAFCSYNFNFDRDVFMLNTELLPEGSFERFARMLADPDEVALFRINFDSLRIETALDLVLTVGMNLSFAHRFERVVNKILSQRFPTQQKSTTATKPPEQTPVPRWTALPVFAGIIVVLVGSHRSISASEAACAAYPECTAHSHVWSTDENCPCLMMIDVDRAPLTAHEWEFPPDATSKVQALAMAGRLTGLQLINRQLLHLPEELRRCSKLQSISLIYTSTETLPSWLREFRLLNYLHVEGKYGSDNLVALPTDLFSDLPKLTYVHLGNHRLLTHLPSFDGTPQLRSLGLALLVSLPELPSFEKIPRLEALTLAHLPLVPSVPDMTQLTELLRFTVFRPHHLCCNGFIDACDLQHQYCQPDDILGLPGASCLATDDPRRATTGTKEVFARFEPAVCQKLAVPWELEVLSDMPSPARIAVCNGVPYRQCEIPGVTSENGTVGMCYNSRMQVLACNVDPFFINVREVQIERGVGPPCDPVEEAWIGCGGDVFDSDPSSSASPSSSWADS